MKRLYPIFKRTFTYWAKDNVPRLGAALAFYTIFSLVPLLLAVLAIAGLVIDRSNLQTQLMTQIRALLGPVSAQSVHTMIEASQQPGTGVWPSILAAASLFGGATGALVEIQDGLNRIWNAKTIDGFMTSFRHRLTALALISGIAFLLLVSLVVSSAVTAFSTLMSREIPLREVLWHGIDFVISWAVITILFALIYKVLPDIKMPWKYLAAGAALASLLFSAGKVLVGLYIGKSAILSTYGAAGSFVVLLIWVYYSAMILYFGAEFAKAYEEDGNVHI